MEGFTVFSHLSDDERWTVNDRDQIQVRSRKSTPWSTERLFSWVKGETSLCQVFSVMTKSLDGVRVQNAKQAEDLVQLKNQVEVQSSRYRKSNGKVIRLLDGVLHGGRISKQRQNLVGKAYEKLRASFFEERQILPENVPEEDLIIEERRIVDQTYRTLMSKHPTESELQALEDVLKLGMSDLETAEEQVCEWYKLHAGEGYPAAQFRLAQLTEKFDAEFSRELHHAAADAGVLGSQIRLADAYQKGDKILGIEPDPVKAHAFMARAQKDDRMFLSMMENRYYGEVDGVESDPQAVYGVIHVYDTTNDPSLRARAAMTMAVHANREGEWGEAIKYANEAMQDGYLQAIPALIDGANGEGIFDQEQLLDGTREQQLMFLAAELYATGKGVQQDAAMAERLYAMAANLDDEATGSLNALVALLERNLESNNYEMAAHLTEKLVERGQSEYRLALSMFHDLGLSKSSVRLPVNTSNAEELYRLGQEEEGQAVCVAFYRRAAKTGSAPAAARLLHLYSENLLPDGEKVTSREVQEWEGQVLQAQNQLEARLSQTAESSNLLEAYQVLKESVDLQRGHSILSENERKVLDDQSMLPVDLQALLSTLYEVPTEQAKSKALDFGARLAIGTHQPAKTELNRIKQALLLPAVDLDWKGPQDLALKKHWLFVSTAMKELDRYLQRSPLEGVFRLAGDREVMDEIEQALQIAELDSVRDLIHLEKNQDVHDIATLIKRQIKAMRLIDEGEYESWIALARNYQKDSELSEVLPEKVAKLPKDKREVLLRLIQTGQYFVRNHGASTKMDVKNMARMWGGNVFVGRKGMDAAEQLTNSSYENRLLFLLLSPGAPADLPQDPT